VRSSSWGRGEAEEEITKIKEGILSREPDTGLDPRTPGSGP